MDDKTLALGIEAIANLLGVYIKLSRQVEETESDFVWPEDIDVETAFEGFQPKPEVTTKIISENTSEPVLSMALFDVAIRLALRADILGAAAVQYGKIGKEPPKALIEALTMLSEEIDRKRENTEKKFIELLATIGPEKVKELTKGKSFGYLTKFRDAQGKLHARLIVPSNVTIEDFGFTTSNTHSSTFGSLSVSKEVVKKFCELNNVPVKEFEECPEVAMSFMLSTYREHLARGGEAIEMLDTFSRQMKVDVSPISRAEMH